MPLDPGPVSPEPSPPFAPTYPSSRVPASDEGQRLVTRWDLVDLASVLDRSLLDRVEAAHTPPRAWYTLGVPNQCVNRVVGTLHP